ncbi:Stk1 family PASTA domain-containing Ser/Thr kinase [Microbacterium hominis]|uniref:non-specific serine/threonine protein kinase n=1 Tax=Microbacterium hominis TaxID=162426 RepID=A0A7D4PMN0_9MICO|nr:Stk1 family PASTA domain-containing Ser/Thr kinase [Microbacterium hominis]QKJ19675.1 Stk1 family PASTA domain-containing Ser/Thr kinase [Microbacterium hominis]
MSTSQQTDPLIGRLVDGRYRVRARIARGGMATVYVATDLRLERRVALKVMHSHLSDDTVFQSRFIQEARAAARLADPHVVNVFDQGQDGEMAYLVMEYLPGITLRDLLREQRRLTVPQAVSIMDAVLSGLAAAHRAGIVHRDVKPENVLLAEDGRVKIGDFGLARATTANTATGAQLLGTIAYLAPELVTRGTADARSDIYALGIMLYEMLVGEQPYKGEQPMQIAFQHATDSVPRPSAKNPGVPEPLDEFVLWATEKNPDERPVDAREMLEKLRQIERELGITPQITRTAPIKTIVEHTPTGEMTAVMPMAATGPTAAVDEDDNAARLRRSTRRRSTRGAWLLAIVLVLAVIAGGAGWWFGSGPGSLVAVPSLENLTFDQARSRLAEDSLQAVEAGRSSLDVEPGLAIGSDPDAGERLDKNAEVVVFISTGPQPVQLDGLMGRTEDEARTVLGDNVIGVEDENTEFFTDASAGTVVGVLIHPRAGGDDIACGEGCAIHQGDTATLWVSVGPVPAVAGMSEQDARNALQEAGLEVSDDVTRTSSDSVAEGVVIGLEPRPVAGSWRPGETAQLIVSTGPPRFPIPGVVGLTRDEAKAALEAEGFVANWALFWNAVPNGLTEVTSQDLPEGDLRVRGTEVYLQITVTG